MVRVRGDGEGKRGRTARMAVRIVSCLVARVILFWGLRCAGWESVEKGGEVSSRVVGVGCGYRCCMSPQREVGFVLRIGRGVLVVA